MPGTPKLSIDDINSRIPFGSRLVAIEFAKSRRGPRGHSHRYILCKCACGVFKEFAINCFLSGDCRSCGCLQKEYKAGPKPDSRSPYPAKLRALYRGMMDRCCSDKNVNYTTYGGRGVKVCDEWIKSSKVFCQWAVENGWKPGLNLDKDIKGNGLLYGPTTCCFVTPKVNNRNRRNTYRVLYESRNISVAELSEQLGINYNSMWRHLRNGKTVEYVIDLHNKMYPILDMVFVKSKIKELIAI